MSVNDAVSGPRVTTCQGIVEGFVEGGVSKFLGMPFAAPPVGNLRWRSPAPLPTWEGVREAKAFGPAPFQTIAIPMPLRSKGISEDCLYLNVWTTSTELGAKQPVMMWFFGGGNLRGAASVSLYDGSELAKLGVTVVTPNYRVGAFGFLNDEQMGANFAVEDQVAALRWVRDNVAGFGGDPNKVMIFGNSAGAVAVRSMLECPEAKGLFQRAFIQSAGFDDPANGSGWSHGRSREATQKLWEALGTRDPEELRAIPAEKIAAAAHPLSGIHPKPGQVHTPLNLVWMPVYDGKVLTPGEPGWGPDVPLLVCCTEHEGRWTLSATEAYGEDLLDNMCRQLAGAHAQEVLTILNKSGGGVFERLDRLYTMAVWLEPAYATMKRYVAAGRTVYFALFSRSGPGAVVTNRLASHGAPVPYEFGNMEDDGSYDEVDFRISHELMHTLVEFARTGKPRSTGGIAWPAFDPARPLQTSIADKIESAVYKLSPLLRAMHAERQDRSGVGSSVPAHSLGAPLPAPRRAEPLVYVSGQLPFAPDGNIVYYDIEAQTRQVLANVESALIEAGLTLGDVIKATVWLAQSKDMAGFASIYAAAFPTVLPTISIHQSNRMIPGTLVELEVVAWTGNSR